MLQPVMIDGSVRWALAAGVLFAAGLSAQLAGAPAAIWWALYLACCAAGGWEPGRAGIRAALRERRLDVDLLMVFAAIGAAAIGQVLDGALLIVIFATSGALEAVATRRTEDSVRRLLDLAPEQASRLSPEGELLVATVDLQPSDVILVRPGERIGADGQIVDGVSEVDQASVTGEPLPVGKRPGDEVYAGTVNGTGALRIRVTRPAADSVVARIVTLVEQASATKARTQLFVERVEQRYSIGMVAATIALFVVPLVFGAAFTPTLLRAMTFMIVASPCAVVLATMPPLLSAIANAGRHGVLVKSAVVMEQIGRVTRVAFDKTGTITEGHPRLTTIQPLPAATSGHGVGSGPGLTSAQVLALAASVENPSEHPLARAVVVAALDAGLTLQTPEQFASAPGQGVVARLNGHTVRIGRWPAPAGPELPPGVRSRVHPDPGRRASGADVRAGGAVVLSPADATRDVGEAIERRGETAVLVVLDDEPVAVLGFTDRIRPEARAAVDALTPLTLAPPMLLTGDNAAAAGRIAGGVGIPEVYAGLLPEHKVEHVRRQSAAGHRLLVVGDGVNDAPALAAAHTGVAMGRAGSDLSVATADAVIVRDDLGTIPAVIQLSRRARRVVAANLVVAGVFIAVLTGWDLIGHLPLPLGVAGHEGSTVIVGLNGLRLLRGGGWLTSYGKRAQRAALPHRPEKAPGATDRR
jgi:cation-transporting P-type ATPase J